MACLSFSFLGLAQRSYKQASVLATGNWYKISVQAEGVYKIDGPFLNALGISGSIPSAQIRVFAGSNGMLPEANRESRIDDLEEVAISVQDGGDGQLNGSDYFLFYTDGPHKWRKDSANRRFTHQKNLYSDKAFYYITIGGNGIRVAPQANIPNAVTSTSTFDERYFHELDSVNFLSSGKEWWGEELSSLPGRTLSRNFPLPMTDLVPGQATLITAVAARSINAGSSFSIFLNGSTAQQVPVRAIGTGQYEHFSQQAQQTTQVALTQSTANLTFTYLPGSFNSQGWINWFEFFGRRNLILGAGKQLGFRDWNTVNTTSVQFNLTVPDASAQVWDVTNPFQPVKMVTALSGSTLKFQNDGQRLRETLLFPPLFLSLLLKVRLPAKTYMQLSMLTT